MSNQLARAQDVRYITPKKTPREVLARALRSTKLALEARVLFLRLPRMRDVCEDLAWHFGEALPYPKDDWSANEKPLLNVCLQHAFARVEAAFEENPYPEAKDITSAFLGGLFYVAHYCQNVTISGREGRVWNPFTDAPLAAWAPANGPITVDAETTPDRPLMTAMNARLALLRRLVKTETMAELGGLMTSVYDPEGRS